MLSQLALLWLFVYYIYIQPDMRVYRKHITLSVPDDVRRHIFSFLPYSWRVPAPRTPREETVARFRCARGGTYRDARLVRLRRAVFISRW